MSLSAPPAASPQLTPEQAAAAHAGPEGAFLVAAGPGTGKTLTMVERFRWLVRRLGVAPDRVLAVTFTDAAATELRERLRVELAQPLEEAWIGTFHGICSRLLRDHAYLIGLPREVRVLDELGQKLLLERLQARLRSGEEPGLEGEFPNLNPDEVQSLLREGARFLLTLKGRGVSPDEFRDRALEIHALQPASRAGLPAAGAERDAVEIVHRVYSAYEATLRRKARQDYDDLILEVIRALRRVEAFGDRCRERFRHLLVDEFQDTNSIQLELIRLLAAPGFGNVTVVGDAKQSIYGWRDAEIENIRTRFPGRRLPLTVNRRSVQEILDCATDFIRLDPDFGAEPDLVAARGPGGVAVSMLMAGDAAREAELVATEIQRLVAAGRRHRDIALLTYSVRQLPREFEDEFRRRGIPYLTAGGAGFFDRQEVKDVLALLRLVADPMDDGAVVRVLQGPVVRLGDPGMYRLARRRAGLRGMRLRDCLDAARAEGWAELEPAVAARVEQVVGVTDALGRARDGLTVADVLNRLLEESGYMRHCRLRGRRDGPRAVLNVRKVAQLATEYEREEPLGGISGFVRHLGRVIESGLPVAEAPDEEADAVRFLTVHGAKGLEFDAVFLVNVRRSRPRDTTQLFFDPGRSGFVMKWWHNDRHPRFRELQPGAGVLDLARQERRRAVYVALTRARDLLYVSATRTETDAAAVEAEADDHFAELLAWALEHPLAARVIGGGEQLELPGAAAGSPAPDIPTVDVGAVVDRLGRLSELETRLAAGRGREVAPHL
ncbi:MAG: ATP-dependent helicase, partial [Candidatus Dormibacteraeota bacterium]|nr:ATP-dependent helicase [Candidatus Dormibacteraeota bacterium]